MKDDIISRAAAIQTAERMYRRCDTGSIADYHELMVEALTELPSAQLAQDLPNGCTDTISRQAAIETVRKAQSIGQAHRMLLQLPPTQPETARRIVGKSRDGMTLWYQCDMCNEPVDVQDNYCRGCGRRLIDERSD